MEDRARGSLLGLAWGDVLGLPVEGWRRTEIERVYGKYSELPPELPLDQLPSREVRRRLRPLGLHSDETQLAMALINACLAVRPWSLGLWAQWVAVGVQRGAYRGYGRNLQEAGQKLARGAPAEHAGNPSAGMSAAARVAPLGALFRDQPELLAKVAMESSFVTHGEIRAAALAFAVARASAMLITGTPVAEVRRALPAEVEAVEAEWLSGHRGWGIERSAGNGLSQSLAAVLGTEHESLDALRLFISVQARPHLAAGIVKAHPNQGFVLLGGVHGLAMGLWPEGAPGDLLGEIMRQGYDTDTVGAICGGLLGARFGTSWIPRDRLMDSDRLDGYAEALVRREAAPETREAFVEREYDLTVLEKQFQADLVGGGSRS